jgi:L-ascorbate metabolism protein UlaG (beta-lactamase superfamily)
VLLTRLGHACVRIETAAGRTVVVDPGVWSVDTAYDGAQAVLVTHEHADHFQREPLLAALEADPALQVWTNGAVATLLDGPAGRVHVVGHGDAFDLDGLDVQVHGEWHAPIHRDIPNVANVGFLIGGSLFHPGDSFTVPGVNVDTLLLPLHGPWSKSGEVIDYVREVQPTQAFPIHDGLLNDTGRGLVANLLGMLGAPFHALATGESVEVR